MSRELSADVRAAIAWINSQPGVTRIEVGRFQPIKHHNGIGFTRVAQATPGAVYLRSYDEKGFTELTVFAQRSPLRDAWTDPLRDGHILGPNGQGPKVADAQDIIKAAAAEGGGEVQPAAQVLQRDVAQLYDVTPDLAATWLEHNTRNRKLRQSVVERYAADMKAGRWMVTGDAIQFDTHGAVINGQHRLWAVLEAGVNVPMMVAFGLDPDVVAVLDDHLKRNLRDVAGIRNPTSSVQHQHASIANLLVLTSIRVTAPEVWQARRDITRQTQLEMLDRHWDAIEFAYRECFKSASMRYVTIASVMTPVARAYYTRDKERLRQFGRVMLTGMTESNADSTAVTLRNLLMKAAAATPGRMVRAGAEVIYRKAERALDAFLKNESLSALFEAPDELFLLPEEQPKKAKKK